MFAQLTLSELEALKDKMFSGFMKIDPITCDVPMFYELHDLQSEVSHEHFTRHLHAAHIDDYTAEYAPILAALIAEGVKAHIVREDAGKYVIGFEGTPAITVSAHGLKSLPRERYQVQHYNVLDATTHREIAIHTGSPDRLTDVVREVLWPSLSTR